MSKIIDKNGYWKYPDTKISRSGIFDYAGWQISDELDPDQIFKVYRPYEEISKKETVDSFNGVPFIEDHEMIGEGFTPVDDRPAAGSLYNTHAEPSDLYGDIVVYSEKVKDSIANGKKELSLGYFCEYVPEKGVYNGQTYDYRQVNLLGNHIALVDRGRMGSTVKVQDSATGESKTIDLKRRNAQDSLNLMKFQGKGATKGLRLVFDTIITEKEIKDMGKPKKAQTAYEKLGETVASFAPDSALLDKFQTLLMAVYDAEEEGKKDDKQGADEKVDKREIIREIMAIAAKKNDEFEGGEEEKIETIAKKAEKLSYNESEAGSNDKKGKDEKPDDKGEKPEEKGSDACGKGKDGCGEGNEGKGKGMDASDIIRAIDEANSMYDSVRKYTGDFNRIGMTAQGIAEKAIQALGLDCEAKDAIPTIKGYIKAKALDGMLECADSKKAMDSQTGFDKGLEEYLK